MRGGEKVLLELVRLFPAADVFTLVWKPGSVAREIEARVRGVSFLQRTASRARSLSLLPAALSRRCPLARPQAATISY